MRAGSSSGHYDPTGAVVMRIEYLHEMDLKWTIAFIHCAELVGLAVLILVLLAKLYKPDNYFIADNTLVLVNACTGIIMWLVLLEFFLIYVHHICRANRPVPTSHPRRLSDIKHNTHNMACARRLAGKCPSGSLLYRREIALVHQPAMGLVNQVCLYVMPRPPSASLNFIGASPELSRCSRRSVEVRQS